MDTLASMTQQEFINSVYTANLHLFNHLGISQAINSHQHAARWNQEQRHANPLTRSSAKYYSQNGEDGIILEIIRRLGFARPLNFIEFGVGDGSENNTLNMLFHGHCGAWFGGEDLAFTLPANSKQLHFTKTWITAENAVDLYQAGCRQLGVDQVDLFSLDLDGVDIYILEAILANSQRPAVIICEYNGKFPPPVEFRVAYDPAHQWDGTDYFGASLASFNNTLVAAGYRLVACDISGVNAFWVLQDLTTAFTDIPGNIQDIYVPANYGFLYRVGHPTSVKTIEHFLVTN